MNKLVYLTILLYSLSFSEEIWEKEIPPSKYLEKLVTEREALRKNNLKYWFGDFGSAIRVYYTFLDR